MVNSKAFIPLLHVPMSLLPTKLLFISWIVELAGIDKIVSPVSWSQSTSSKSCIRILKVALKFGIRLLFNSIEITGW